MSKVLITGNEALAEAAVRAGCRSYFGYPITPQNEIPEFMSRRLPEIGGTFIQAESEIAAINMLYGAAAVGERAMTSSSSPGISLMQEGISYIASAEIPCLIVNVNRGGPGLGTIQPSQGDYFQATKGGGHGDYHMIVLAPASVQEMADFVYDAFDLADRYRTPVMILSDGSLGQMMEKVEFRPYNPKDHIPPKEWATTGKPATRARNIITSLFIQPEKMEQITLRLQEKYRLITEREIRFQELHTEDAEILFVAYGMVARIAHRAVELARQRGIKAGLLRPITLYPFPTPRIQELAGRVKGIMTVEMNAGQMVEDVRLAAGNKAPVEFYGRMGGIVPTPEELLERMTPWSTALGVKADTPRRSKETPVTEQVEEGETA